MRYSQGFKHSVLRRVLPPSNEMISSVARETGVSDQTIRNWLGQYNDGRMSVDTEGFEPNPSQLCTPLTN